MGAAEGADGGHAVSTRVPIADLRWHPVAERLPEDKLTQVLIYAPSLDPEKPLLTMTWWEQGRGFMLVPVWAEAVTHWMYLPEPPAEVEP